MVKGWWKGKANECKNLCRHGQYLVTTVVPLKNHFTVTFLKVLKADAAINMIKFWEYQRMCHQKMLY